MKTKIIILAILCIAPIVFLGCSEGNVNENFQKSASEESKENDQKDLLRLYKDSKEDYVNIPNLIGDTQISDLKFALNEDKSVNGYKTIEDFDMTLLDNISSFRDIENILKVEPYIGYREEFVDIKLDEIISNPNIILSRAKFIGELASNHDYDLTGIDIDSEQLAYMIDCVAVITKLDGLGLNSNDDVKFRLLNYLIDNTDNIKDINSPKEIFEYTYILNYLLEAFMNSPEGTYSYLLGIDILLDYRLNMISLEEPNSLQERLLKGASKWIEEGLEKMKTYK